MTEGQGSVSEQAKKAVEMIETQLHALRALLTLYIRPGKETEPLRYEVAREKFGLWKSRTRSVLSGQINAGVAQEFERRVERAAAFARSPGLEMMEQMDMAQQFLEALKAKLKHQPEQVFASQND